MNTLLRFSIAAIVIAFIQSTATAAPVDLAKGLGQFTWGMKRDVLLREAKKAYGAENVKTETEAAGGYPEEAVIVRQGAVTTRFSFMQNQFFAFSRTIYTELTGYVTKEEVENAHLEDRAKELFVAPEGIALDAAYTLMGTTEDRVTAITATVSAKNTVLADKITTDLRAKSPSLIDTVITPLGKP